MLLRNIPVNLWNLVSPLAKTFDLGTHARAGYVLLREYEAFREALKGGSGTR